MYRTVIGGLLKRIRMSDFPVDDIPFVHSKSQLKKLIKAEKVLINDEVAETGTWLNNGAILEIIASEISEGKPYEMALKILYEDEYIIAIDKPSSIITSGNKHRTLENAIYHHCLKEDDKISFRPRCVHRLDNQTSGIVIAAKSYDAMRSLQAQFLTKNIKKEYLAIIQGRAPDKMTVSFCVGGKRATSYAQKLKVIDSSKYDVLSLVGIKIVEGRTHQIRIHMNGVGHPVVGDKIYNNGPSNVVKGLFLHAWRVQLIHPMTKLVMKINSPLPKRFKKFGISPEDLSQY